MAIRRYELTNEQRICVEPLIQHSKTGRPIKGDRTMANAMLWIARSGTAYGKQFTADFASGVTTEHFSASSKP